MVYFTCNNCGDSLPKPKVEKHYQTACSRNPINVTCIDCHKDFRENAYVSHTKCMTEMERYSDKSYVAKPNKGEQKQSAWIDAVQSLITETINAKPAIKDILKKIASYDNVPRKKVKFMNFMQNCAGGWTKDNILEEVWTLLEEKQKELKNDTNKTNGQDAEKKENGNANEKPEENGEVKSKKRKLKENGQETIQKEKVPENEAEKLNGSESKAEDESESPKKKQKIAVDEPIAKFEWKKEIMDCLSSNNNEISMKKLRKKIVDSYIAVVDFDKYFMKKLNKIKGVTIKDDVVKLDN